jgi:hypothetical protein
MSADEMGAMVEDALWGSKYRAMQGSFHMVIRQAQAAYAAGLRDGPEACMEWLGNALAGPGNLPSEGADPQWYADDAWTDGPPWPTPPAHNATANEPADPEHNGRTGES